ncbi:Uncharacterised protein [Legionella beliardensis]|uniref:Uncharacterized protein n=1 Tax=Legionella beliardensis TaxID=91822 RepID=A0A378JU54_9GAMM|nr:Uncharacterised protein [Legionella beliardensis]
MLIATYNDKLYQNGLCVVLLSGQIMPLTPKQEFIDFRLIFAFLVE